MDFVFRWTTAGSSSGSVDIGSFAVGPILKNTDGYETRSTDSHK